VYTALVSATAPRAALLLTDSEGGADRHRTAFADTR
jgi:hypothetical protein